MTKIIPLLCFLFIFDIMPFVAKKNHKDFTILAFRSVGAGKEKPFLESAVQLHKVM
jgi:hypothetical protein